MLYKKYHRNFVSQFKIGTKVKFICDHVHFVISDVKEEPFIEYRWINTLVSNAKLGERYWVVVFPGGKINKDLHVI